MIDLVFLALPVIIISVSAARMLRYMPWDEAWMPPSSRLSLLGVGSTILLLGRFITTHKPWYSIFFVVLSNVSMFWAYRTALQSEERHREHLRKMGDLGG